MLASRETLSDDPLELLRTNPHIRFSRQAVVGAMIESWLLAQGLEVEDSMDLENLDAISSMVYANLGVSLAPKRCVATPNALPLKHLSLSPPPEPTALGLLSRFDTVKVRVLEVLVEKLRDAIRVGSYNPAAKGTSRT